MHFNVAWWLQPLWGTLLCATGEWRAVRQLRVSSPRKTVAQGGLSENLVGVLSFASLHLINEVTVATT